MNVSGEEAAEALLAMKDARVQANEMKRLPFLYHLAMGALMSAWVAAPSLPSEWFVIGLVLFLAATWGMYRWQLQATSRWINGFRTGRTLWIAVLMVVTGVGLVFTSSPNLPTFEFFTPLQGSLIAFVVFTLLDWLWVKAYDSEMRIAR